MREPALVANVSAALGVPPGRAPQVWLGEGGGAYNSGRPGASDTFASSFWCACAAAVTC